MLRRELTGFEKFRFLVWVVLAGMLVGLLPDAWPAYLWWIAASGIVAANAGLAILSANLAIRRAVVRFALPENPVVLEEWQDRLLENSGSGSRSVGYDEIAQVIETEDHVFLRIREIPLIVPRGAFADPEDMAAFARRVDEKSMKAQP